MTPRKHLQVLLIEDSEADAVLTMRVLEQSGYSIRHERVESAAAME